MSEAYGEVKPKEVTVIWRDAKSFTNEWLCQEEINTFNTELCQTRGWLMSQNDTDIAIAQNISALGGHNIMLIPKGCVEEVYDADNQKLQV